MPPRGPKSKSKNIQFRPHTKAELKEIRASQEQIPGVQRNFDEYSSKEPKVRSTLDYLLARVRGGRDQAIRMACYGPLSDERSEAILGEWLQARSQPKRMAFKLEEVCKHHKLKPSEFVGMVVAGMSQMRLDYEEIIRAQEMPDLLEKSFEFAKDKLTGWQDRHELMKASGLHLAPKQAQIVIDQRDQRTQVQLNEASGLPSFEDTLKGVEQIGQRRLPESTATTIDLELEPEREKEQVKNVAITARDNQRHEQQISEVIDHAG